MRENFSERLNYTPNRPIGLPPNRGLLKPSAFLTLDGFSPLFRGSSMGRLGVWGIPMGRVGVFIFSLLTLNAFAQRDSTDSVIPVLGDASARWVIKIAPLFLLDPENTAQFGVERTLGGRSSVQVEAGYGWPGLQYNRNYYFSNKEVWRGRAEWRYYSRVSVRPRGSYFAIEGFYKQVNAIENGTVGRACNGGFGCQYFQQYRSTVQKFVVGGHIKWGKQFRLDDRWLLDFYGGIGLRSVMFQRFRPQFPDSFQYSERSFSLSGLGGTDEQQTLPTATLGLKIGYVIR